MRLTTLAMLAALAAAPLAAQPVRNDAPQQDTPRRAAPAAPPEWAMPRGPGTPPPSDSAAPLRIPGSSVAFTYLRTRDRFDVPDWFPASHPAMPPVVARGRPPAVMACAYCHLADGGGRPENAALAGLPAEYVEHQVAAMRDGTRGSAWPARGTPWANMKLIADSVTPAEVAEAARYFAALRARQPRSRVVEAATIPRVRPAGGLYFFVPDGGTEPLGGRLVEVASDAQRHELHDPRLEYVAYVPPGSVARGRALARRGAAGPATACTCCHGAQLRGVGLVPPIAGRSPSYLLRQLVGFAAGARATPADSAMRAVAAALTLDDMIAAAAYAGSRDP